MIGVTRRTHEVHDADQRFTRSQQAGVRSLITLRLAGMTSTRAPGAIDLYWIPLGADAHVVRLSGKVYEAIAAFIGRRPRCALYHTALEVDVPDGRYVIESAPIRDTEGPERGVVAEAPVGTRWAGRFRLFRYEIRRWRGGAIPDANAAVGGPIRVANDVAPAQRVLDLVPSVPTPVWGRDELHTGDMWNSNSLISWLLVRAGLDTDDLRPPPGGRAPGWDAGIVVAGRERSAGHSRRRETWDGSSGSGGTSRAGS